jgi:predicted dehydrogenase
MSRFNRNPSDDRRHKLSPEGQDRREFLRRAIAAGTATAAMGSATTLWAAGKPERSPNEKLNIGVIGVAARGAANLNGVAHENVVALCDIDAQRLGAASEQFPKAQTFKDYRRLIDEAKIDALVVSTPDHSHALPIVRALKAGLDTYCEKPLAHNVWEVRQMRDWAATQGAVTQMGTQIHAGDNYRRVVELVQAGAIGAVNRVHVWQGNGVQPGRRVEKSTPPAHIDYDLWIGGAPMRPFDPSSFHFNWRYWWDFGGGTLADMGCHYIDLPFWALGLRYPDSIEAEGAKTYEGDNEMPDRLKVDYQFPARDGQPPVQLTWYHGGYLPEGADEYGKGSAVLFEGERGRLLADYGSLKVFTDSGDAADVPAETIPASIGHHREWTEACKTRGTTTCNFDYSGALAETVLLGNVSYRVGGKKLEWDHASLQATNCPEADQFIRRKYRKGWRV